MRVALAGFLHETNTFAPARADLEQFQLGNGYIPMARGAAMPAAVQGVNLGMAGALVVAEKYGWEIEPILWAGAIPSAHVTEAAFETIAGDIIAGLAAIPRPDGVFLDLHGAMVAEHLEDGEGEIARRVRAVVGPEVPVVAALDLHGNISAEFVELVDALVGFRTYPHVDMAETGQRAAEILHELMQGQRLAKAYRRMDYLVPIPFQCTDIAPGDALYARIAELEQGNVRSASLFMGFPATDIADCGPAAMAFAPTQAAADHAADRLAAAYAGARSPACSPPSVAKR